MPIRSSDNKLSVDWDRFCHYHQSITTKKLAVFNLQTVHHVFTYININIKTTA